jgi:dihydrofolate reductase
MAVTIVAAVARNGVIGVDGGLPWRLPDELRLFKETTLGHVLVMGRRTFESIGRPLPGRRTVVVTRQRDWSPGSDEVVVAHDPHEALERAASLGPEVFVVGGAEVYAATIARADRLALTFVDQEPAGDTLFPEIDWSEWHETGRRPGDGWVRVVYERARPRPAGSPGGAARLR